MVALAVRELWKAHPHLIVPLFILCMVIVIAWGIKEIYEETH